eukprot:scaffold308027_cov20-Tisochrysis_lutea.AAC.2
MVTEAEAEIGATADAGATAWAHLQVSLVAGFQSMTAHSRTVVEAVTCMFTVGCADLPQVPRVRCRSWSSSRGPPEASRTEIELKPQCKNTKQQQQIDVPVVCRLIVELKQQQSNVKQQQQQHMDGKQGPAQEGPPKSPSAMTRSRSPGLGTSPLIEMYTVPEERQVCVCMSVNRMRTQ